MSRQLTIVGASVRAAAFSARRAGYTVHAADLFGDADMRRACRSYHVAETDAGIAATVSGPQCGGWMFTGGLENKPGLVQRLARLRPLLGNSASVLRSVRRPERVAQVLARAGLPVPLVCSDPHGLPREGSWLLKGLRSSGGGQVAHWLPDASLPTNRAHYFQQYVEGLPCSAVYLAAGRRAVLLGATQQLIGQHWTGASGFRYCGSIGPLVLDPQQHDQLECIGRTLAEAFNLVGLFGVDAVINPQGVWTLEVNPRYTASIEVLERALDIQTIALHAAACAGDLPEDRSAKQITLSTAAAPCFHGKAILFATRGFIVTDSIAERWSADLGNAERSLWRPASADIPNPGTTIEVGWPILTVFASADSQRGVLGSLRQQSAGIRSALEQ